MMPLVSVQVCSKYCANSGTKKIEDRNVYCFRNFKGAEGGVGWEMVGESTKCLCEYNALLGRLWAWEEGVEAETMDLKIT